MQIFDYFRKVRFNNTLFKSYKFKKKTACYKGPIYSL